MPDRTLANYFNSDSSPPAEQACQVLARDETGEYQLPFVCHWRQGAWYAVGKTKPLTIEIVGWRVKLPGPE